jgi:Aldo/keto reductase family
MRTRGVQIESWGGFAEGRNNLFSDPTLTAIGDAHGKSVAQVVLRWLIQREIVAIPKSVRRERMEQNLNVFDFTLTDDEMAASPPWTPGPRSSSTTATRPWSAGSTVGEIPDMLIATRTLGTSGLAADAFRSRTCDRPPCHSGEQPS